MDMYEYEYVKVLNALVEFEGERQGKLTCERTSNRNLL